jgi:hypothetical protein
MFCHVDSKKRIKLCLVATDTNETQSAEHFACLHCFTTMALLQIQVGSSRSGTPSTSKVVLDYAARRSF